MFKNPQEKFAWALDQSIRAKVCEIVSEHVRCTYTTSKALDCQERAHGVNTD